MLSSFDIFQIGIGPSSSHTMGPMRAARRFAQELAGKGLSPATRRLLIELYGSLGATGAGHGSDSGVLLGLMGMTPEDADPDTAAQWLEGLAARGRLPLWEGVPIAFDHAEDLVLAPEIVLERHANAMRLTAFGADGEELLSEVYYSIGGGAILAEGEDANPPANVVVPYPFRSSAELFAQCQQSGLTVAGVVRANDVARFGEAEVDARLDAIWQAMQGCIHRGLGLQGGPRDEFLPGPMRIKRRAAALYRRLEAKTLSGDHVFDIDWVNAFAMAVNEENASGGRVVTAPTNGAAGIIPAVLQYVDRFVCPDEPAKRADFLLTAAGIGMLYKMNASISGAEMGCQGEVGVACSMAAGALAAVMGGSPEVVENAAEIGMEHNLGLTCDPVGGRVQIPCIERNAMGAVKAINAARLALNGEGGHYVSLDAVIETMRQTGEDMKSIYKETALGGLAVNVIEC